jgi:hypothetical protein
MAQRMAVQDSTEATAKITAANGGYVNWTPFWPVQSYSGEARCAL